MSELLPIAAALVVIVVSPGPNVLAVTLGAARSRRLGVWTAIGVSTGDMIWTSAAIAGLGSVLTGSHIAFVTVKWLGAAYLLYLAVKLWRDKAELPADLIRQCRRASAAVIRSSRVCSSIWAIRKRRCS